jgi:hypothetical protein
MKNSLYVLALLLLCANQTACAGRDDLPPRKPAVSGSTGDMGGAGGSDDGPCDVWTDADCCETSDYCPEGSLGACLVDVQLCGGECVGKPNPLGNVACNDGNSNGACVAGECETLCGACGPFETCGGVKPSDDPDNYSAESLQDVPLVVGGVPTVCGGGCTVLDTDPVEPFCGSDGSAWVDTIVCAVEVANFENTLAEAGEFGFHDCKPWSGTLPDHVWCCRHD